MNQKIRILKGPSAYSPSTLLIPSMILGFFVRKVNYFGSVNALFHYVVNHMHVVYGRKPISRAGRITYQPSGQELYRKDFFPNNEDWEKFRMYAQLQRISMSYLFVLILMDLELFERDSVGVPRIPAQIQLIQTLTITEIFTYLEIQHLIL